MADLFSQMAEIAAVLHLSFLCVHTQQCHTTSSSLSIALSTLSPVINETDLVILCAAAVGIIFSHHFACRIYL